MQIHVPFGREELVVHYDSHEERASAVNPEENAKGSDEPWAGVMYTVFLHVVDDGCDGEPYCCEGEGFGGVTE